ncbi:MAG: 30S ribosomal protein S15 [Elusimicrobia bacterium]|nr:30S ribosomal protein S15 [Elusimicrobiota bacterium]MDE2425562.1 30S ribosomal protein S15 [Elusimicrobiota bacterium]
MITKEAKAETVKKHGKSPADTGDAQVQIALLTERIKELSGHMKSNKKDYASQLGLLKLIGRRRRLLSYLKRSDLAAYGSLLKQLELRK